MGSNSGRNIWWGKYTVVGNCQDGDVVRANSSIGVQKGQGE